jgi:hypothetical protein
VITEQHILSRFQAAQRKLVINQNEQQDPHKIADNRLVHPQMCKGTLRGLTTQTEIAELQLLQMLAALKHNEPRQVLQRSNVCPLQCCQ